MSKVTKSKLSNTRYLAKRLAKLSSFTWEAFECDGEFFSQRDDAVRFARKVAQLRGRTCTVHNLEVPSSLPQKQEVSVEFNESTDHLPFHDVEVYVVLGKPFLTFKDAEMEAMEKAEDLGKWVAVMSTKFKMASLDFEQRFSPAELARRITKAESEAAEKSAA